MNLKPYLRQTVMVEAAGEPDRYGEYTFSEPTSYPARKELVQRQVRNSLGQEILSSTRVTMVEEFQIGDLIDGEAIQDRENIVPLSGIVAGWIYYLWGLMARGKKGSGKYGRAVSGGRHHTVWNNREHVYRKLKKRYGAAKAARIANAGHTKIGRKKMARKAAATRKMRGR
jgi:hypothetical protein